MRIEEKRMAHDDLEPVEPEPDPEEVETSWLTADDAAEAAGITKSALTRRAQQGTVRRTLDSTNRYRYDPNTLGPGAPQDFAQMPVAAATTPAAETVLSGGAKVVSASGDIVTQCVRQVLESHKLMMAQAEATGRVFMGIVNTLEERCKRSEELQVELIKAREDYLSLSADRALVNRQAETTAALKEKALGQVLDNLPLILEGLHHLLRASQEEPPKLEQSEETDVEPPNSKDPV